MKNYFLTLYKPVTAFKNLLEEPNYFRWSFIYMLIPISAYTLMYIFLTMAHGAPSVFTPWLNIPREDYYAINRFLLTPGMLTAWFMATAIMQVLSHAVNGKGTFEQTLAVLSLSISISMWGGLIHDLPMSFFSATGVIDARQHEIAMNSPTIFRTLLWTAYSVYFIAFLSLFTISVRVAHKVSWVKSFFIGTVSFAVFQVMFLLFNR